MNFIGILFSFNIIYRNLTDVNSSDLILGIICLTTNVKTWVGNDANGTSL